MSLALFVGSCSHGPKRPAELDRPTGAGHEIVTLAILGTNDLHGALAPLELKTREADGATPIPYKAAGVATLASYVKTLRSEFGSSLIWLDGGDQYQGSVESNLAQGSPMVQVLNALGVDAAAVGNHEFDFGPSKNGPAEDKLGALKERMVEARFPYLAANIRNKASGELASGALPKLAANKIIDTGKIKVGVLGLTTLDTPRTTTGLNVRDLVFADLKDTTLRESKELRAAGADIVVIVTHAGLKCERGRSDGATHIRTPNEPQGDCGSRDEITQLLNNIPTGTVDAVVAGHTHQVVHHWIAGVPVIQGGAFGRFFNIIYLNFDLSTRKLLPDYTRIEGPVPVCPEVFQNQGDCNGERPAPRSGRGKLVKAQFHGETVREDAGIRGLLEPYYEKSAVLKKEVIATAARPIEHERFKESPLGDLVADAMREVTGAQVALMNSGGIRMGWEQGPITFESVFKALPFDNQIVRVHVSGKELREILKISESGSRGFFSVSGVRMRLIAIDNEAPGKDLNGDGRIDAWEVDRIVESKGESAAAPKGRKKRGAAVKKPGLALDDGSPVTDDGQYTLATLDFLLNGGDDLGWATEKLPASRQDPPTMLLRDAVLQRMKKLAQSGPLNTPEHPLLDPANPRLMFEKTQKRTTRHRRGHSKRK